VKMMCNLIALSCLTFCEEFRLERFVFYCSFQSRQIASDFYAVVLFKKIHQVFFSLNYCTCCRFVVGCVSIK